jgi:hypothetical protein
MGNEAEGKGAPLTEPIAPNPTESSVAGDIHPSAISQIATAASGNRQKKKNVLLVSKHKQPTPSADQVMTHINLPLYHGP